MDTPTLDGPEDWIAVVGEVLTSRGVGLSTRERLLAALRAAPSPEAAAPSPGPQAQIARYAPEPTAVNTLSATYAEAVPWGLAK